MAKGFAGVSQRVQVNLNGAIAPLLRRLPKATFQLRAAHTVEVEPMAGIEPAIPSVGVLLTQFLPIFTHI